MKVKLEGSNSAETFSPLYGGIGLHLALVGVACCGLNVDFLHFLLAGCGKPEGLPSLPLAYLLLHSPTTRTLRFPDWSTHALIDVTSPVPATKRDMRM